MKRFLPLVILSLTLLASQQAFSQGFHEAQPGFVFDHPEPLKAVQLYPNPAIDYLAVHFDYPIAKRTRFTFHNIIGNAIEVDVESIDDYEIKFKIKDLPAGYYILALSDQAATVKNTYKFVKR